MNNIQLTILIKPTMQSEQSQRIPGKWSNPIKILFSIDCAGIIVMINPSQFLHRGQID
jgi:hypothetical protein